MKVLSMKGQILLLDFSRVVLQIYESTRFFGAYRSSQGKLQESECYVWRKFCLREKVVELPDPHHKKTLLG